MCGKSVRLWKTNIRQRGIAGGLGKKVGLRIKELDRIYENSCGGDRKSNPNNYGLNHQQMAKMMGVSVSTLENYKKLTEIIPELEDLVETGILDPTIKIMILDTELNVLSCFRTLAMTRITIRLIIQYIIRCLIWIIS